MRITLIYDDEVRKKDLIASHGFSCLVEAHGKMILFDTGANGSILLHNMERLSIDPTLVEEVFISHAHGDHIGGLSDFLRVNPVKVYVPQSCSRPRGAEVIKVSKPLKLHENIFSTGELRGIEQSLAVKTEKGLVVVVGCSHPGVRNILKAASKFGEPYAIVGGLHGFKEFDLLKDLGLVCPCHCTYFKSKIRDLYPEKCIVGEAGVIITL